MVIGNKSQLKNVRIDDIQMTCVSNFPLTNTSATEREGAIIEKIRDN